MRPRIGVPIAAALALFVLIDTPRLVSLGPISLSGAITLGLAVVLVAVLPAALLARFSGYSRDQSSRHERFIERQWTAVPWALGAFIVYAVVRLIVSPSVEGTQNVALYVVFGASIVITATLSSAGTADWARLRFSWLALAATALFIVTFAAGVDLYGERSYAMISLVFLAVLIPLQSKNIFFRLAPYAVLAGIVLSLSRTAAVIGLAMLVFLVIRNRRGKRLFRGIALLAVLVTVGFAVIWNYAPFRDRFFGGDNAIALDNGLTFNTSGRDTLWGMTEDSWVTSPWFGNGPGSAQALISAAFRGIAHPHNEYLRILHDFGVVGLVLFAAGALWLLAAVAHRALRYDRWEHWAAFLALLAILLTAWTDNPFIYQFVMIPVAALVGLSLASPPPPRSHRQLSQRASQGSRRTLAMK